MNVFVDNCLSPVVAAVLDGFLSASNDGRAHHIKDMPCGRHATDEDWIAMLGADHRVWLVLTGDIRIQRNAATRRAYRDAKLCGFVLAPSKKRIAMHQTLSFLLWRWPEVEDLARLVARPALFELPMHSSAKIRPLPL